MATPLSARLADEARRGHASIAPCWRELLAEPDAPARFRAYMVETFHYIRFSCPLMELAATRLSGEWPMLSRYLRQHVDEEAGHDNWMLDDLARLGFCRERVRAARPLRQTQALVGTQIFAIEHAYPLAYFGYIYALETGSGDPSSIRETGSFLQIPEEALSTFLLHAQIDRTEHVADLERHLDETCLGSDACDLIIRHMNDTFCSLAELVYEIATLAPLDVETRLAALRVNQAPELRETPHAC